MINVTAIKEVQEELRETIRERFEEIKEYGAKHFIPSHRAPLYFAHWNEDLVVHFDDYSKKVLFVDIDEDGYPNQEEVDYSLFFAETVEEGFESLLKREVELKRKEKLAIRAREWEQYLVLKKKFEGEEGKDV